MLLRLIQKRFCCKEAGQKTRDLYMFKPIISVVETIVKLALFCIPTFSLRFKLSDLNSNLALTLGYLNPALNNSALDFNLVARVRIPL